MTPHNEHIMLKLARAEQHEHSRAADALSRLAWARPRRRAAVAATLVAAAALAGLLLAVWPL